MDSAVYDNKESVEASRLVRPRTKKRRRKPVMGLVPRYIFIGICGIAMVILCGEIIAKIAQPYAMQSQQSAQIRQLKTQLASDVATNQDLDRQINFVQRPEGVETAARGQGFLKPGEVSLEINIKTPPDSSDANGSGVKGLLQRAWNHWVGR